MVKSVGYKTKQREALLAYLKKEQQRHVTAYEIAEHFKCNGIPVGLTTIYRQLEKLQIEGIVRKFAATDGESACYQYISKEICRELFHLKCDVCGKLEHLSCDMIETIEDHLFSNHSFKINPQKTVFYGNCSKCLKEKEIDRMGE